MVVVCAFGSGAFGQYGGGMGEPNNPYLIGDANQMNAIGANPNDWDKHFKLVADVNLSACTGTSFNIIGTYPNNPFSGAFDGNGHTISNFTYSGTSADYTGLFGSLGENGEIKDLGLINADVNAGTGAAVGSLAGNNGGTIIGCYTDGGSVSGHALVGGLVGKNGGVIVGCYSSSGVLGANNYIGGLVGRNVGRIVDSCATGAVSGVDRVGGLAGENYADGDWSGVTIMNCYSSGDVTGGSLVGGLVGINYRPSIANCYTTSSVSANSHVGGLVGYVGGIISNCYSTGSVSGTLYAGGLVGYQYYGSVANSFWDKQSSGRSNMCGGGSGTGCDDGNGKTTAEMQMMSTFTDGGWDFIDGPGPSDDWAIPGGGGYPILSWQLPEDQLPGLPVFSGGTGEGGDPYLISTGVELNQIGHNPRLITKHFKLTSDIDLSGVDFYVIGNAGYPYSGVFDGNGHIISDFTRPYRFIGETEIGVFGYIEGESAQVRDVGLTEPNVDGGTGWYVGSVAGVVRSGTIENCYVEGGNVSGQEYVGGLVGRNGGVITDCYSTGSVFGGGGIGGLVGKSDGTVTNCHSSGGVLGTGAVGGLVGKNQEGLIQRSSSSGSIGGGFWVGGLVGENDKGSIKNCYARGSVSGEERVGGLAGESIASVGSSEPTITNCYSTGSVEGVSAVGGLVGHNYGVVFASFWDTQTSGEPNSGGGTGLTTTQMQNASTFIDAGWDFVGEVNNGTEDIWYCDEPNYPQLAWEAGVLLADIDMDELWMYQSMPGQTGSTLTAGVSIADDPMGNTAVMSREVYPTRGKHLRSG